MASPLRNLDSKVYPIINPKTSKSARKVFSYSGSDFNIWLALDNPNYRFDYENVVNTEQVIPLDNVQTITTSYASSVSAVEVVGSSIAMGFTRGMKTFAGTVIFTVMDSEPLLKLLEVRAKNGYVYEGEDAAAPFTSFDQMPPFNIILEGRSELPSNDGYPQIMRKIIYGVVFMAGGEAISIDDFFLEQQHQYLATYVSPWVAIKDYKKFNLYTESNCGKFLNRNSLKYDEDIEEGIKFSNKNIRLD